MATAPIRISSAAAASCWSVCNWAPRRPFVLHPPEDPLYLNLLLRSADEGRTWSAPVVAPAYGWSGVECAGLTDSGRAGCCSTSGASTG